MTVVAVIMAKARRSQLHIRAVLWVLVALLIRTGAAMLFDVGGLHRIPGQSLSARNAPIKGPWMWEALQGVVRDMSALFPALL